MHIIHRHSDGTINMDFYRAKALQERREYIRTSLPSDFSVPSLTPAAGRRVKLFLAAFAVATGAFWATMLTDPPKTVAGVHSISGLNISDLVIGSSLPAAEAADAF